MKLFTVLTLLAILALIVTAAKDEKDSSKGSITTPSTELRSEASKTEEKKKSNKVRSDFN